MASDAVLTAGVRISSGRKPVTFAAVDERLNIVVLAQWEFSEAVQCLMENVQVLLAIHTPGSKTGQQRVQDFRAMLDEAGFKPYAAMESPRRWIASNADACFRVFQPNLFPRQSLVGRLQRALILYDEGLQIPDPMDFFEEVTRHKLLQGILPGENIYSSGQLDALVMAFVSWMAENPSAKLVMQGSLMLPAPE